MKKYESVISVIMLCIISLSNVATPVVYAAPLINFHFSVPKKTNYLPSGPITSVLTVLHQDQGSVLGTSTSLLNVGTQALDIRQTTVASAYQRIPIQVQKFTKKVYQTDEDVTFAVTNPDNDVFTTSVTDASGKQQSVSITESNNGSTTTVNLVPSNSIKPGLYKVTVTDSANRSTEQDFTWGVLALNTDKSMYHPGDTADIAMAVLNNNGDMVCDAQVKLDIQRSDGSGPELSTQATGANQIVVNPQCQLHDYSLQPDYEGHYTFPADGTYTMTLTATTVGGTHTITDTIQVKDNIPFDVQRVSATRIYPPNTYPMLFNITANRDFDGTVTETVPDSFTITPATESAAQSYKDMQTVYLNSTDPTALMSQQIATASGGLVMPFHGSYPITQGFGAQLTDPTLQAFYTQYGLAGHDGIDFGVPMDTPLYAVDEGDVIWSGPGDYGTMVTIHHSWGQTYYGHMSNTSVTVGEHIQKGQLIGYSGMSGEATGPHLHFGMKPTHPDMTNGYYGKIDPMPFLPIGQEEPISMLGSQANPVANLVYNTTVLGASDSAATPTPSDTPITTPGVSPTTEPTASPTQIPSPTPTAPPTASPTVLPDATEASITPTPTQIPSVFTQSTTTPNSTFTVLDKEIKLNEQIASNALTQKVKVLTWTVHLKKGEQTTLGYDYQIPNISPEFYLLGPAKFYEAGNDRVIFQEDRQWQLASDDVGVEWYSNTSGSSLNGYSWQFRKKITISHTMVSGGSNLSSFPVLISISSDSSLNAHALANGNDILFTDSTGETLLPYEIESYSSGTLTAWVNISSLSSSIDTIIYMYYGNPSATGNTTANVHSTWSGNYAAVWHLGATTPNGATLSVNDSTSNGDNGTNSGATYSSNGEIDGAASYNGTTNNVSIGNPSNLSFGTSTSFTITQWVNESSTATTNGYDMSFYKGGSIIGDTGFDFELANDSPTDNGTWIAHVADSGTDYFPLCFNSSNGSTFDNAWHFLSFVVNRSTHTATTYLDGVQPSCSFDDGSSTDITSLGTVSSSTTGYIGQNNFTFKGTIDETEISKVALSAGWIKTEYTNQTTPSDISEGTVETHIYAPNLSELMRNGFWFNSEGVKQPSAYVPNPFMQ